MISYVYLGNIRNVQYVEWKDTRCYARYEGDVQICVKTEIIIQVSVQLSHFVCVPPELQRD